MPNGMDWEPVSTAPNRVVVETKIDDCNGARNIQELKRDGNLWWFPDGSMYVYYRPTHWRNQERTDKMSEYKQYRRTQIAEMADWDPGFDMKNVSISGADASAGSPKLGDKIARNPANHADKWLVAKAYFEANFEPLRP